MGMKLGCTRTTEEEKVAIIAARRRGIKLPTIAYDVGRHLSTVCRIVSEAGVPKPRMWKAARRGPLSENFAGILSLPA
jgi:hypothetical protein